MSKPTARPLLKAAKENDLEEVKRLIAECGYDYDLPDMGGLTALMYAAASGHLPVVKYLIDVGASFDLQDEEGQTALMYAAARGHLPIVQYLTGYALANSDLQDEEGQTALMLAAENNHPKVVQCLVEKGANIDVKNNEERTALMIAAELNHPKVLKILFDAAIENSSATSYERCLEGFKNECGEMLMNVIIQECGECVDVLLTEGVRLNKERQKRFLEIGGVKDVLTKESNSYMLARIRECELLSREDFEELDEYAFMMAREREFPSSEDHWEPEYASVVSWQTDGCDSSRSAPNRSPSNPYSRGEGAGGGLRGKSNSF